MTFFTNKTTPQYKQADKRTCIECGSVKVVDIAINLKLSYCHCKTCGHCVLIVLSNSIAFENAQKQYFSENLQTLTSFSANQVDKTNKEKLSIIREFFTGRGKVIEVGPGIGFFADLLLKDGHEVTLIEHSRELVSLLRNNDKFIIHEGEFETMSIEYSMFDLFVSLHVIEHVVNPMQHLSKGFDITKPGGYALIATPNASSWQQLLYPFLSPNFDSAHLRVYSLASLKRACERSGWLVKAEYTPEPVTGWLRVITKIIRKIKKEDEELSAGRYSAHVSKKLSYFISLFGMVTFPFRVLQKQFLGGNEIVLICQKPINYLE